jgi:hypothetical protein
MWLGLAAENSLNKSCHINSSFNNPLFMDFNMHTSKTCSQCKTEKNLESFSRDKNKKTGLRSKCKDCEKENRSTPSEIEKKRELYLRNRASSTAKSKEYYSRNRDFILEDKRRQYYEKKDVFLEKNKMYYQKNKDKVYKKQKEYYSKNKHLITKRIRDGYNGNANILNKKREYREKNAERISCYQKKYRQDNFIRISFLMKRYVEKNRYELSRKKLEYIKIKCKSDHIFSLKRRIRRLITISISNKGYSKKSKTCEILGCDYKTLIFHLESTFTEGMSWDVRDKLHIDHIVPMASAKTEEDVIRLNHYTNLQMLWAADNIKKGAKIITPV